MRIVFLGPPGAGKGTQAERLAKSLAVPHISTGEMMRAAIAEDSELGRRVKGFLDRGVLVPDDVVNELVAPRLSRPDCAGGYILDGYPRTLRQAEVLDSIVAKLKAELTAVIELAVPTDSLVARMVKRGKELGRSDDTEAVIRERLRVYETQTKPLTDYYSGKRLLKQVDGEGAMEEVELRVMEALGK